jgi:hypothetical protein
MQGAPAARGWLPTLTHLHVPTLPSLMPLPVTAFPLPLLSHLAETGLRLQQRDLAGRGGHSRLPGPHRLRQVLPIRLASAAAKFDVCVRVRVCLSVL